MTHDVVDCVREERPWVRSVSGGRKRVHRERFGAGNRGHSCWSGVLLVGCSGCYLPCPAQEFGDVRLSGRRCVREWGGRSVDHTMWIAPKDSDDVNVSMRWSGLCTDH